MFRARGLGFNGLAVSVRDQGLGVGWGFRLQCLINHNKNMPCDGEVVKGLYLI